MKRICFLFFFLFSLFVHSQTILSSSVQGVACESDTGYIYLDVINVNSFTLDWFYEDTALGWIPADTTQFAIWATASIEANLSDNNDSLVTQKSGNYKVVIAGDTSFFYVSYPLGSRGSHKNVLCHGDSTGLIKRVAHSGEPPYTYEWFKDGIPYPPNTSPTNDTLFDNLLIGFYLVIITDDVGCIDSSSGNIISPILGALSVDSIITDSINCRGTNQGGINLIISGGKPYTVNERYNCFLINNSSDTVAWVTRDSLNCIVTGSLYQINDLIAGEYTLSIVDSNECILDTLVEVIEPVPYEAYGSTIGGMLICESDSGYFKIDSVVVDSVLGSENIAFGFEYNSITGINVDSIYVPSGEYDIYVYDSTYSCIDMVQVPCEVMYAIKVVATTNDVNCFGDSTGEIVIDLIYDGNAPYDVQWGGVNSSALPAGTYPVHIVDAIGCLKDEVYVVNEGYQIIADEVLSDLLCYGDTNGSITIDPSGGTGILDWDFHNMGQVNSLNGLAAGSYILTVTDDSLCQEIFNISLLEVDTLVVSAENYQPQLLCTGELTTVDILISGGTTPYSILWDDGDTNLNRVVGAGSYTVQVTDENGCAAQDLLIIITEPDSLSISIADTAINCTDGGVATVIVSGGVAPFSYLWSTGDTTQTIDSLSASTYWVFVTDSCGNSVSDTVYFDAYELLTEVYYDDATHIAEVEIESTNSAGPFSYEWRNNENSILGQGIMSPVLCEGTYFVVTTDISNNCFVEETFDVEFYLPLGSIKIPDITSVYPNSDLWGFGPYTYKWEADTALGNFQDVDPDDERDAKICPGYWLVEVRDINDCPVREYFEIEPLIISFDPESASIKCDVKNLPICITVVPDLGTRPYSFEWWNGDTAKTICSGITPGDLNVTVEDANGCKEDASFEIEKMTSECIPDVFTPDGDGMNDTWNLEDAFLFSDSEIRVYGRYGKLLFEKVAGQAYEPWDGTNKKGNDVPDGVYFYSIDIGHGFDPIKGTVTILRRR